MARHFFDLRNDVDLHDDEGLLLPDLDAALTHARMEARELICASVMAERRVDLRHKIEVR